MSNPLALRALLIVIIVSIGGCQTAPQKPVESGPLPLIPMPVVVERGSGHFELAPGSALVANGETAAGTARYFADLVERTHGTRLTMRTDVGATASDAIIFELQPGTARTDGDESYRLNITPHRITLTAGTPHGLFNGAVTLWQLLAPGSNLVVNGEGAAGPARYFADLVERTRGLRLTQRKDGDASAGDAIVFQLQPGTARSDGDESYRLSITPHRITLTAGTPHGIFNGAVTLWQLLVSGATGTQTLRVPCVQIDDYPRFAWRGLLFDSARHFQSPESVKHFIDTMALHKLNVMHWHLTDDQGWRIQIKKYPKLTEIGAWRQPQPDEMQLVDPATGKYGASIPRTRSETSCATRQNAT